MTPRRPPAEPKFLTYSQAPTEHEQPATLNVTPTVQSELPWAHKTDHSITTSFPGEHPLYPQVEAQELRLQRLQARVDWWVKAGITIVASGCLALAFLMAVELGMFMALLAGHG